MLKLRGLWAWVLPHSPLWIWVKALAGFLLMSFCHCCFGSQVGVKPENRSNWKRELLRNHLQVVKEKLSKCGEFFNERFYKWYFELWIHTYSSSQNEYNKRTYFNKFNNKQWNIFVSIYKPIFILYFIFFFLYFFFSPFSFSFFSICFFISEPNLLTIFL